MNTLIVSFAATVIVSVLWITNEISRFNREAAAQKEEYISSRKEYIQNEVLRVVDYVQNMNSEASTIARNTVRSRVYEAYETATNLYTKYNSTMNTEELQGLIKEALRNIRFNNGDGYFFANDFNGKVILFSDRPELEGTDMLNLQDSDGHYVVRDIIEIAKNSGEGFYNYKWTKPGSERNDHPKIAYIKAFPQLNIFIGAGIYPEDIESNIQSEVKKYLGTIKIEEAGYIFGATYDGVGVIGPQSGINVYDIQDTNGKYLVRELIAAAKRGGGFVEYVMPEFADAEPVLKLSYVAPIPEWEWYLGFGIYVYRIDDVIAEKKSVLTHQILLKIAAIITVLLAAFAVSILLSRIFSSRLQKDNNVFYEFYKHSVFEDEKIDLNTLYIEDFVEIARLSNEMVEKKQVVDDALKERLEERSILIQEIHHRVKNNFQAIASLFNLQAMETDDPKFQDFITDAVNRLHSMSAVHDLLYQNNNFSRINFKEYLELIISNVFNSTRLQAKAISKRLNIDYIFLSIEEAVPLGMIINELLTNSGKYAFPDSDKGEIVISMRQDESSIKLEYQDSGVGLPEDAGLEGRHGFGYQIIKILLVQLNADCRIDRGQGFYCSISIPRKTERSVKT